MVPKQCLSILPAFWLYLYGILVVCCLCDLLLEDYQFYSLLLNMFSCFMISQCSEGIYCVAQSQFILLLSVDIWILSRLFMVFVSVLLL